MEARREPSLREEIELARETVRGLCGKPHSRQIPLDRSLPVTQKNTA